MCYLGWRPNDRGIKIFRQYIWFVNLHLTFIRCCYIVDDNKYLIFFSVFLDLQSIRDNEATTSKELIFFNALTDVPITSRKTRDEVANSGKMKASELFRKYLKTPIFDHSNYRLFERIPAVPGTSNNRGLTVHFVQLVPNRQV